MDKLVNILLTFAVFALIACDKDDATPEEPLIERFVFEDGFETMNNSLDELLPPDGSRWSAVQQSNPMNATNEISISDVQFSQGQNALRLFAFESDNALSKMDIEKSGFSAFAEDSVVIEADFYINTSANIENLFLIDLECCSCWDTSSGTENQCPGVRLKMSGGNDFLAIERGKISESTLEQTSFQFPRNEWVRVTWEMVLSDGDDGQNILKVNGAEILNSNGANMPNAQTFQEVFAEEGINFTLQEPTFYERIQIGATANDTAEDIEMFVDDFSIRVERNVP